MTIEQTSIRVVHKPWGSTDLRPWRDYPRDGIAVGELWFERVPIDAPKPALLLKLLFTTAPLSIQVHPDDECAQSIGLANGKTEAWYILSAQPGAQVAIGLKRHLSAQKLRAAIEDGSIADLVQWRGVRRGDAIVVPAGTIHAIGAGLVVAEIQQRSDATFRLFDHGRQRELHVDHAVAAARVGPVDGQPADCQFIPRHITDARTLLAASRYFVLEHIDLRPGTAWNLHAEQETWLLVLDGDVRVGLTDVSIGDGIFLDGVSTDIAVGVDGVKGLLAYPSSEPRPGLLRELERQDVGVPARTLEALA